MCARSLEAALYRAPAKPLEGSSQAPRGQLPSSYLSANQTTTMPKQQQTTNKFSKKIKIWIPHVNISL